MNPNMSTSVRTILLCVALGTGLLGSAQATEPDSSTAQWARKHLWAGDSVALIDSGFTFEIHREASDLYLAAQSSTGNEIGPMLQLHGFLFLMSPAARSLFESFPRVERIRFMVWVREKSHRDPVLKIRLNRSNHLAGHPDVIAATATEDPGRFLKLCRKKFDAFWMAEGLGK